MCGTEDERQNIYTLQLPTAICTLYIKKISKANFLHIP